MLWIEFKCHVVPISQGQHTVGILVPQCEPLNKLLQALCIRGSISPVNSHLSHSEQHAKPSVSGVFLVEGKMPEVVYRVLPDGVRWKVRLGTLEYSPYDTRDEVIRAAIEGAHAAGKSGLAATVIVETANGRSRTVWTYGRDQYPPP
jgi:hypothetical protein